MLVCSCNFITESEIRETIRTFLDEDCWQLIVPGKVYHAMQKRGRCCGCFPNVVDLIVDTTREYHLERHTGVPEMAAHLDRLNAYYAQHVPQVKARNNAA